MEVAWAAAGAAAETFEILTLAEPPSACEAELELEVLELELELELAFSTETLVVWREGITTGAGGMV